MKLLTIKTALLLYFILFVFLIPPACKDSSKATKTANHLQLFDGQGEQLFFKAGENNYSLNIFLSTHCDSCLAILENMHSMEEKHQTSNVNLLIVDNEDSIESIKNFYNIRSKIFSVSPLVLLENSISEIPYMIVTDSSGGILKRAPISNKNEILDKLQQYSMKHALQ